MSQGFGSESVNAKKSAPTVKKPRVVAEIGAIQQSLVKQFSEIKDPRVERTKKHQLADIIVIANKSGNWRSARLGRH